MTIHVIGDIHLSEQRPDLIRAFLHYMEHIAPRSSELYLLGDIFEYWIGDDHQPSWLNPIIFALKQYPHPITFFPGNRDFAVGDVFLKQIRATYKKSSNSVIGNTQFYFSHGDEFCTDDISYQRFKRIIQNPVILFFLKKLPLSKRKAIAKKAREKSKKSTASKNNNIMDVNKEFVELFMGKRHIDVLIHGHTHRPKHHIFKDKQRWVLGDWHHHLWFLTIDSNGQVKQERQAIEEIGVPL